MLITNEQRNKKMQSDSLPLYLISQIASVILHLEYLRGARTTALLTRSLSRLHSNFDCYFLNKYLNFCRDIILLLLLFLFITSKVTSGGTRMEYKKSNALHTSKFLD